ncbi:MAG: dTMP kinase [Candidatus Omnitrophota bacterium]
MSGRFITFEGAEGSGKSTQIAFAQEYLKQQGHDVLLLREPGGVKISERVRDLLLDVDNTEMCRECEVLLYMAARAQLVAEVLVPALEQGRLVLCDRFLDSTLVYQGYGIGVALSAIRDIGRFATRSIRPDITLVFDIDAAEGLRRAGDNKDRIEQRSLDYHQKVREGYLELSRQEPERIRVISADRSRGEIFADVRRALDGCLEKRS